MLMPNDKYWEALAIKVGIPRIMCNYPTFMSKFKIYVESMTRLSLSQSPSEAELETLKMKIEPSIKRVHGSIDEGAIRREKLDSIQARESISIVYDPKLGPNALPSVVFDDYGREPIRNGERHVQSIFTVDSQNTIVESCTSKVKDDYLGQSISRYDASGKCLETTRIEYNAKNGEPQIMNHEDASGKVDRGKSYKDGRLASEFFIEYLDDRTRASSSKQYDESGKLVSTRVNRVIDNVVRYEAISSLDSNGNVVDVCENEYRPNKTLSTQKHRAPSGALVSSAVYGEDGISNEREDYYESGALKSKTAFSKDEKNQVTTEKISFDESGKCNEHFMEKVVDGRISEKAVEYFENGKSVGASYSKYTEDGKLAVARSFYPSKRIKSSISYEYPDEHTVSYSGYGYAENGAKKTFTRGQVIDGIKKEAITQLDEKGNAIGVKFLNYDANGNIIENSPERSDGMAQAME